MLSMALKFGIDFGILWKCIYNLLQYLMKLNMSGRACIPFSQLASLSIAPSGFPNLFPGGTGA